MCYDMRRVKLAVVTKPDKLGAPARKAVLDELKLRGAFDVTECDVGDLIPRDSDRVLVFGGDGTILDVVRALGGASVPILGVNVGKLGFLASCDGDCVQPDVVADMLQYGNVTARQLIDCSLNGCVIGSALNEAAIRAEGTRPVTIEVRLDGNYIDSYRGDGVIVATPTGSTAYSLSAGGPVLAPAMDALIINAICAHSLHARPLVVGGDSKVELTLKDGSLSIVSLDGRVSAKSVAPGAIVTVCRSSKQVKFVGLNDDNFYKKLLDKMNDWGFTRH